MMGARSAKIPVERAQYGQAARLGDPSARARAGRKGPQSSEILVGACLAFALFTAGGVALGVSLGVPPFSTAASAGGGDQAPSGSAAAASSAVVVADAKGMPDFSIVDRMSKPKATTLSASESTVAPLPAAASLVPAPSSEPVLTKASAGEARAELRVPAEPPAIVVASLPADATGAIPEPERLDAPIAMRSEPAETAPPAPAAAAEPAPATAPASPVLAALPPAAQPAETRPAPARAKANPEELALLRGRAEKALEQGDIGAARLLLERASRGDDVGATLLLAQTYDPAMLQRWGIRGLRPDPARAQTLYERARTLGSRDAEAFLSNLKKVPGG